MVIDSSALVAIVLDEPERTALTRTVLRARERLVSSSTVVEAGIVLAGRRGEAGLGGLERTLRLLRITVLAVDAHDSSVAVRAFLKYGKGRHRARLNFGDCISYAVAKTRRQRLLYKGDDFSHTDVERAA
jgi:ribonuclease VapC